MNTLLQDLRYGARMLWKNPGFTLVAVLALALGIGANTAIFSVVNAVLLRPLSYPDSERIIWIQTQNLAKGITDSNVSAPDMVDWANGNQAFEQLSAFTYGGAILQKGDEAERVRAASTNANFFTLFKTQPRIGRTFSEAEDQPGGEDVAILSYGLWQRQYGGAANIVGNKISLGGKSTMVIGVMPRGFDFPERTEIWLPLGINMSAERRDNRYLEAVGRLKPSVTIEQASAQLNAVSARLAQEYAETNSGSTVKLQTLHEMMVGDVRPSLLLLLGAVAFVLLIACTNVANLLLARAAAREKEIAIRTALGAGRLRVIRQLLTESVLLSVIGGVLGLLLSVWLTDLLVAISPANTPRFDEIKLDGRVLLFTIALTVITGLVFGLAPALQASKSDLNEALKDGGRGSSEGGRRNRIRSALMVSEIALSFLLLVGAGLLVKSFLHLREVSPGFNPENVLTMRLSLRSAKYPQGQQKVDFYKQALENIKTLPGVQAAGAVLSLPLGGDSFSVGRAFIREGRPMTPEESANASYFVATPDYFRTMQIPLVAGRAFTDQDNSESPMIVVVNETMARRYWPNENAIGRRITIWRDEKFPREIVGVVGDTKPSTLDAEAGAQMYVPYAQDATWGGMSLAIRTTTEPTSLTAAVRKEIAQLDKGQPVYNVKTMTDVVSTSLAASRVSTLLLSVFAGAALLLAMLGIYGITAYYVTQRTHEIGIRMALGARTSDVFKLVVNQAMMLVLIGVALGIVGAIALTRVMSSLLYGVSATDPLTFIGVSLLLALVALVACLVPARKATKVDPMVALRYE
jgi:putative ABC transport system permease protein